MSEILIESPLVDCKRMEQSTALPERAPVRLGEQAGCGVINLRGALHSGSFAKSAAKVLGVKLPDTPNTWVAAGDYTVCWLGPEEWLLLTPAAGEGDLITALRGALTAEHTAVIDVTGGHAVITLNGPAVRDILAKGCTLDLHRKVFAAGCCAQTVLAKAGVLLVARADDAVDVVVRRSFSDYLWRWLVDAAEGVGLAVV